MHWQATCKHGGNAINGPDGFDSINFDSVRSFAIVQPLAHGYQVVWEANAQPLAYARRETPNEAVHVIEMPDEKVFVFEGTGAVIRQPLWGTGVFAPIERGQHEQPAQVEPVSGHGQSDVDD